MNSTLARTAALAALAICIPARAAEQATSWGSLNRTSPMEPPSFTTKVANAFRSGTSKITGAVKGTSSSKPANSTEPTKSRSIFEKPAKPSAQLYVSLAQLQESAGNFDRAEQQYQKALEQDPNDLAALLGYARLRDRQNDLKGATTLYQRAVVAHPLQAAPHNDLGLCYHRRRMLLKSLAELNRAVELQPSRALYRNNLADVLVAMGKPDEAFRQLSTVNPPPAAHYNLGCMLARVGANQLAVAHFQQALAADPSLTAANDWIAQLAPNGVEAPSARMEAMQARVQGPPPVEQQPLQAGPNESQYVPQRASVASQAELERQNMQAGPPEANAAQTQHFAPPPANVASRGPVMPAPPLVRHEAPQSSFAAPNRGADVVTPRYTGPVTTQLPARSQNAAVYEPAAPPAVAARSTAPAPSQSAPEHAQYAAHDASAAAHELPIAPMPEDLD